MDNYEVGDFVSNHQFICNSPGQLRAAYGREYSDQHLHGGTIYNGADTFMIWIEKQVSLGSNDTVIGKSKF